MLEHVVKRWEDAVLNNPGYEPKPSDMVAVIQALRGCEELILSSEEMEKKLKDARANLEKLEGQFLGLLSGGQ